MPRDLGTVMPEARRAEGRRRLPIAPDGFRFLLPALAGTAAVAVAGWGGAAVVGAAATGGLAWFFRDPERRVPSGEGLVVSPADGRVVEVDPDASHELLGGAAAKVGFFLSIFDVHVNRIPHEGKVEEIRYRTGRFWSAMRARASRENERNEVLIGTPEGWRLVVVQVAGLIARRIVSRIAPGDIVRRGQRFGMIRFGSRVDLFLPREILLDVRVGQRVKGGATVVGRIS